MAPDAVVHNLHNSIAGHVSHNALSMQHSIGPVARVFGPLHEMRVVVAHAASDVNLRLQEALAVLRAAFVDMANIHAAVFAVNGHGGLRLGIGSSHSGGSHSGGRPVFVAGLSLSHRNRSCCRCNTDSFQILFEINSIFFHLY
jgi:hypothetical protein